MAAASALIMQEYVRQEEVQAQQDVALVSGALAADLTEVQVAVAEMRTLARAFAGGVGLSNETGAALGRDMLLGNGLDRIYFGGSDGNGTYTSGAMYLDDGRFTFALAVPLPVLYESITDDASGIHWQDGEARMLAATAIGTPDGGFVLVAERRLDAAYMDDLARRTGVEARVLHPDAADGFRVERSADRLTAFAPADALGSAVAVRVDDDRDIYASAITTITWFAAGNLVVAVAIIIVTAGLLRRWVTGPIGRLQQQVQERDPDAVPGDDVDEIQALERSYSHLMDRLAEEQRQLEDSNRDLASFASVVSHDLKSPLSTLRLTIGILRRRPELQDPDASKQLSRMERSIENMHGRIDGILAYSKAAEQGQEHRPVALDAVMRRVQGDLGAAIASAGARIEVRRLPRVMADPEPVAQLLQNLLANAIKYAREDVPPRIRVWATREGDGARIHVRDNGRGFNAEEASHMMDPFVRLASAEGTDGHGIGLATCRRIVERHGSTLDAAGQPGAGAEFSFVLPLAPRRPRPERPARVADAPARAWQPVD